MIEEVFSSGRWLPYTFALLIGLSMLLYAVLDGYDLGVGLLSSRARADERETMIASIGPFWDANETWLVLGVGLLLVAFPRAHGLVLSHLYLPVAALLIALVFRGVAYEFRSKDRPERHEAWNRTFAISSLVAAVSQGYMVGSFMIGFQGGWAGEVFSVLFGALVVAAYTLVGATWLILKCEDELQRRAIHWAKRALLGMILFAILTSIVAVQLDTRIYDKMFAFPAIVVLAAMPVVSAILSFFLLALLKNMPFPGDRLAWMPFALTVLIFVLGFLGLVYSFYPYVVPGQLKIVEASASPESLRLILLGTALVLPFLFGYTIFAYRVFRGKARVGA